MSDWTCTHERTECRPHAYGLLEKLTCRDCDMIRGKATDWLPPDLALLAGGMEARPSESSADLVYLKRLNPLLRHRGVPAICGIGSTDLWQESGGRVRNPCDTLAVGTSDILRREKPCIMIMRELRASIQPSWPRRPHISSHPGPPPFDKSNSTNASTPSSKPTRSNWLFLAYITSSASSDGLLVLCFPLTVAA